MYDKLTIFKNRLSKIGIEIKLVSNYPWIYLVEVNGNVVEEKRESEHNFTIGFLPIKKDMGISFLDWSETFDVIRKYCK